MLQPPGGRNRGMLRMRHPGLMCMAGLLCSFLYGGGPIGTPEALAAGPVNIADDNRLDPRLGAVLRAGGGAALDGGLVAKSSYGVSVLIRGDAARQALEAVGAVVGTQAGSITTADVPIEAIP